MSKCDECGSEMKWFRDGHIMCSRLYELALARSLAGDMRVVDHGALKDEPLVRKSEAARGEPV